MDYSNAYEGEATRFVPCTHEMAIDAAADMVDKLHEEGWQPSDIAVLATGHEHPEQANRQAHGWESFRTPIRSSAVRRKH